LSPCASVHSQVNFGAVTPIRCFFWAGCTAIAGTLGLGRESTIGLGGVDPTGPTDDAGICSKPIPEGDSGLATGGEGSGSITDAAWDLGGVRSAGGCDEDWAGSMNAAPFADVDVAQRSLGSDQRLSATMTMVRLAKRTKLTKCLCDREPLSCDDCST
jgi:hypothetical protein